MDFKPHQPGQAPIRPDYPDRDLRELVPPELAQYLDYHMTWDQLKRKMSVILTRYAAMAIVFEKIETHIPDEVIDGCYTPLYGEVLEDLHLIGELIEAT